MLQVKNSIFRSAELLGSFSFMSQKRDLTEKSKIIKFP